MSTAVQNVNLDSDQFQMDLKRVKQCPACHQKIPEDRHIVAGNIPGPFQDSEGPSPSNEGPSQQDHTFEDKKMRKRPKGSNVNNEDSKDPSRKRKTKAQIKVLEQEMMKNPHWSNEHVEEIS